MKQPEISSDQKWDLIIRPRYGWFDIDLRGLWRYRDLIMLFVKRDFLANYKQTVLGPLWFVIQPVMTSVLFLVVFGQIARIPTGGMPPMLFYMSGIVMWTYFSECLTKTSSTFIANAGIFGKVYFPRLVIPFSIVISNLMKFAVQFLIFIGFFIYFVTRPDSSVQPNIYMLLLPVLLLIMALMGLGLGIIVSSFTTRYRDLTFLITFAVQLLMYLTPIIYPASIWGKYEYLIYYNPMAGIIETFRFAFLGTGELVWHHLVYSACFSLVALGAGVLLFSRVEKTFMDTV